MSTYKPAKPPGTQSLKDRILGFVIVLGFSLALLGAGFVANITVVLDLKRGPEGVTAKASNNFAGQTFYLKTIGPVETTVNRVASTNKLRETMQERARRQRQKSIDLVDKEQRRLGWGRERDQAQIEEFLRGTEPSLVLIEQPPAWRSVLSWISVGLGGLTLVGGLMNLITGEVPNAPDPRRPGKLP